MPNHCSNEFIIKGSKEDLAHFIENYTTIPEGSTEEQRVIDCNKIIPMPEELNIESGGRGESTYEILRHSSDTLLKDINTIAFKFEKFKAKLIPLLNKPWETITVGESIDILRNHEELKDSFDFELGEKYFSNKQKYGYTTWYDWRCAIWGTKWGAYDATCEMNSEGTEWTGVFYTAWVPAANVYRRMVELNPKLHFTIKYKDEGGAFAGTYETCDYGILMDTPFTDEELKEWHDQINAECAEAERQWDLEQAELKKKEAELNTLENNNPVTE